MGAWKKPFILILLLGLALRVVAVLWQQRDPAALSQLPDQGEYLQLGSNLVHHGVLSLYDSRFGQNVYAYRTPGYPAFVALCGAKPRVVGLAQAAVDSLTILAVAGIARRLSGSGRIACIAAGLTAFNPFLIYFTSLILTETLFTALLVWGIYFVVRNGLVDAPKPRDLLIAGLFFSEAIMVRPSIIALPILMAVVVTFCRPKPSWLRNVMLLVAPTLVALGLWGWRNHNLLGRWVFTTTNAGVTLYDGFNPAAKGESDQRFLTAMPELLSMNEVERDAELSRRAKQWAMEHPADSLRLAGVKLARTWSPVPLSTQYSSPVYKLAAVYAIPFDLLIVIGLFTRGISTRAKLVLILPAALLSIVHALSVGSLRYRIPAEPMLAVVAATIGARKQSSS